MVSTTLLIYVYTALYAWSTSKFAFAGLVGFVMFSTITLRKTSVEYFAALRALAARAATRKYRNAGIAMVALLVMFAGHGNEGSGGIQGPGAQRDDRPHPDEGIIIEMLVREGSRVAKGDVLARLRDFDKQQKISAFTGDLQAKESELALLRAGAGPKSWTAAEAGGYETRGVGNAKRNQEQRNQLLQTMERRKSELQLDQQNLARSKDCFSSGLIPRAELEKAETAVKVREREIGEIEASIRVISESSEREGDLRLESWRNGKRAEADEGGNRPEQIHQVEADVEKLRNQVAILDQGSQNGDSRADRRGYRDAVRRAETESASESGDELARIVDMARVTVEMQVPEKGTCGCPARQSRVDESAQPAGGGFSGACGLIAPVAQTLNGQQTVVVRSELQNDELLLKPDMTGVAKDLLRRSADHRSDDPAFRSLDPHRVLGSPSLVIPHLFRKSRAL